MPQTLQELGVAGRDRQWTRITFTDDSQILVHWDGRYEVSSLWGEAPVAIHCPNGTRIIFPWHRIAMIEHFDPKQVAR